MKFAVRSSSISQDSGETSTAGQMDTCLTVQGFLYNPITVGNFAFLFNCTPVGRTSDSMMVPT